MSEQQHASASTPSEKAVPEGYASWSDFWKAQGMPWRTEPEIDEERQGYLAERRAIQPDIEKGIYPFKDIKLDRADIEWLLAAHESGGARGPVDWSDERQRTRDGLDLRGADLRRADLRALPLARLRGGLLIEERRDTAHWQDEAAALHLEEAALSDTHLEGASLSTAYLRGVFGRGTHLEQARLDQAHLEQAEIPQAHLEAARLISAHLEGASLLEAHLEGANLHAVRLDSTTYLRGVRLSSPEHGQAWLVNVVWGGANLNEVDWSQMKTLGAEQVARHPNRRPLPSLPPILFTSPRVVLFEFAVQAYRQLATALRAQAVSGWADHFAYRGQVVERQVLWRRHQYLRYFGSLLLDLISGYGYRPARAFITYALVIVGFMALFLVNSQFVAPHLSWNEALVLSVSSFHGRGFFNPNIALGDTYAELAAGEAVLGLFIEITFIATFTQRFFAR
jgi:uncharacterized protein YjbI with pentapeptide repeats